MDRHDLPSGENLSRLALSCSALARAGQVLGTVSKLEQVEGALGKATAILEEAAQGTRLSQIENALKECRALGGGAVGAQSIAECRKLAATMARMASALATEVQQLSRKPARIEPAPAARDRAGDAVAADAIKPPAAPVEAPAAAFARADDAGRTGGLEGEPARRAAGVESDALRRLEQQVGAVSIAVTPAERAAVRAALGTGSRYADVKNGTTIDTRTNLMWAAKVGPAGGHDQATAFAAGCRTGGYGDWRLPRVEELRGFLNGGGREFGEGLAMFGRVGGGLASALWTSETARKWFILRQATAVEVRSGFAQACSAGRRDVHVLVVRSG